MAMVQTSIRAETGLRFGLLAKSCTEKGLCRTILSPSLEFLALTSGTFT